MPLPLVVVLALLVDRILKLLEWWMGPSWLPIGGTDKNQFALLVATALVYHTSTADPRVPGALRAAWNRFRRFWHGQLGDERPWIETEDYAGPCRRRLAEHATNTAGRRSTDRLKCLG